MPNMTYHRDAILYLGDVEYRLSGAEIRIVEERDVVMGFPSPVGFARGPTRIEVRGTLVAEVPTPHTVAPWDEPPTRGGRPDAMPLPTAWEQLDDDPF